MSRGKRQWVEEGGGLIRNWDDFEQFPWDQIVPETDQLHLAAKHLPKGMKIATYAFMFEHVMEVLLGMEGLFYLLMDEPELVRAVFEQWGQKVYDFYAAVIEMDAVGAIFHADDLGFKSSSFISRKDLQTLVFPWFKKYADLAHQQGKMYWYHSCGNHYTSGIMEDFIDFVGIDAFHSFQDVIMPVAEFKDAYGDRVAALGGVDMHVLSASDPATVRTYVRNILDHCAADGRFALSSGNTIANYIPLENYFVMLDEARNWQA
jgi:uroporphyrinogen decarboxylase